MKRIKHITINLTQDQYNCLLFIAERERRKISDLAYLLLSDNIESLIIKYTDVKTEIIKR